MEQFNTLLLDFYNTGTPEQLMSFLCKKIQCIES